MQSIKSHCFDHVYYICHDVIILENKKCFGIETESKTRDSERIWTWNKEKSWEMTIGFFSLLEILHLELYDDWELEVSNLHKASSSMLIRVLMSAPISLAKAGIFMPKDWSNDLQFISWPEIIKIHKYFHKSKISQKVKKLLWIFVPFSSKID